MYRLVYGFSSQGISPLTVLDIGANRGMFSRAIHYVYPKAKIFAFEPLHDCYNELKKLEKEIPELETFNTALADTIGETEIHRSSFDYSSSLLEMGEIHKTAFPHTSGETLEKIALNTLDNILQKKLLLRPLLMKIDVQGYEKFVLNGAVETLKQTDYIICEMSFQPLYKEQALFDVMYQLICNAGFRYAGQVGEMRHPQTSEVLQIDGLFVRK